MHSEAKAVAQYLIERLKEDGSLSQRAGALEIRERFGEGVVYTNHLSINRIVLVEFHKLADGHALWDNRQHLWRWRQ
jgi:hypothetical protein